MDQQENFIIVHYYQTLADFIFYKGVNKQDWKDVIL